MAKYEHTTVVLHFDKKDFALRRRDLLEGLSSDSAKALGELGESGWELVAALPYSSGNAGLAFQGSTDAAVAFFKRSKA